MDIQYLNQLISTAERVEGLGKGENKPTLKREKFDLDLQKFELSKRNYELSQNKFFADQYQKEVEKVKYSISTLTNLYGQTKSLAAKNHIRNTMKDMYGAIDPVLKKSLEPYIQHSPISNIEQKALNYDRLYGKQIEPRVEKEKDSGYLNYTKQWFQYQDKQAHKDYYVTGKEREKVLSVSLPEGYIGIRSKDGKVSTLSPEQQQLEKTAEKFGVGVGEIITSGGWLKSGEEYFIRDNEGDSTMQDEMNIFTKERRQLTKKFKEREQEEGYQPTPLPKDLRELLTAVITKPDTNLSKRLYSLAEKEVERAQKTTKKGEVAIPWTMGSFNQAMQQIYPDWVFLLGGTDHPTLAKTDGIFYSGNNFEVRALHAKQLTYQTKKGKIISFFSRWEDGQILNSNGTELNYDGLIIRNQEQLEALLVEQGAL